MAELLGMERNELYYITGTDRVNQVHRVNINLAESIIINIVQLAAKSHSRTQLIMGHQ